MYKLDLTDIYIRKEIEKTTKDNKVNPKQKTLIDNRMKRLKSKEQDSQRNKKGKKRRYLTIRGVREIKNIEVEAVIDENSGQTSKGIIIDKVK